MKITGVRGTDLGGHPLIRVLTDAGIDGYSEVESNKPWVLPMLPFFGERLSGADPTLVESTIRRIRRLGGNKPWGALVSAIEIALWDIAGKAAGLPVHRLLGGRVRDRVRVYDGGVRFDMAALNPDDYALDVSRMRAAPEGFTLVKEPIAFHSRLPDEQPWLFHGQPRSGLPHPNAGPLTDRGLAHLIDCVAAMRRELGDEVGLALDCGPGWTVPDAIRFTRAIEGLGVTWVEDLLSGDYFPYTDVAAYREVTRATSTPTPTGEQLYLRQNLVELVEQRAVRVVGPDPADVGGLAELKWIAEFADLHGVLIAPHGVFDGLLGLAALTQVCATMPDNFLAFEYPVARPSWWYDIVEGLPAPILVDGHIAVGDEPGLGVRIVPELARPHLTPGDRDFFA